MLNLQKLHLTANHKYFLINKDNNKVYFDNAISVTQIVSEWYYIIKNFDEKYIPYSWIKDFEKTDTSEQSMQIGSQIHEQIATNTLSKHLYWIQNGIPTDGQHYNELSLIYQGKHQWVGTIDKVIEYDNGDIEILEFKNSFNAQTQKDLFNKAIFQLHFYGYLFLQNTEILPTKKIKLTLLIFEHWTQNVLSYHWEKNLSEIHDYIAKNISLWENQCEKLKAYKCKYLKKFQIESLDECLNELYNLKNDVDYCLKAKKISDLEKQAKNIINNYRCDHPEQKAFLIEKENSYVGYQIKSYDQLNKENYIKYLENELLKLQQNLDLKLIKQNKFIKKIDRFTLKEFQK